MLLVVTCNYARATLGGGGVIMFSEGSFRRIRMMAHVITKRNLVCGCTLRGTLRCSRPLLKTRSL
jgi:hypothetical protein